MDLHLGTTTSRLASIHGALWAAPSTRTTRLSKVATWQRALGVPLTTYGISTTAVPIKKRWQKGAPQVKETRFTDFRPGHWSPHHGRLVHQNKLTQCHFLQPQDTHGSGTADLGKQTIVGFPAPCEVVHCFWRELDQAKQKAGVRHQARRNPHNLRELPCDEKKDTGFTYTDNAEDIDAHHSLYVTVAHHLETRSLNQLHRHRITSSGLRKHRGIHHQKHPLPAFLKLTFL